MGRDETVEGIDDRVLDVLGDWRNLEAQFEKSRFYAPNLHPTLTVVKWKHPLRHPSRSCLFGQ
jgi:hypothetical protein